MSVGFSIGFSIVALILAVASLAIAVWGIVEVLSFRRSTHNIQYVPLDKDLGAGIEEFDANDRAYREMMAKANEEFMRPPMQDEVI